MGFIVSSRVPDVTYGEAASPAVEEERLMRPLGFQGQVDSWDMLPNLRYDKLSEVFGCCGEYVTEPSEIHPALYRAFNSGKAAVVNVLVDNRVVHPWFESLSIYSLAAFMVTQLMCPFTSNCPSFSRKVK